MPYLIIFFVLRLYPAHSRVGKGNVGTYHFVLVKTLTFLTFRRTLQSLRDEWWNSIPHCASLPEQEIKILYILVIRVGMELTIHRVYSDTCHDWLNFFYISHYSNLNMLRFGYRKIKIYLNNNKLNINTFWTEILTSFHIFFSFLRKGFL